MAKTQISFPGVFYIVNLWYRLKDACAKKEVIRTACASDQSSLIDVEERRLPSRLSDGLLT